MSRQTSFLLLAFITLAVIGSYFYQAVPGCLRDPRVCFGDQTIAPVAPFRYRVLQPALEAVFVPGGDPNAVLLFDFGVQSVLTVALFAGLYLWLRTRLTVEQTLIGCSVMALVMVLAFHFYLRSLGTTIEAVGMVWGGLCLSHMRRW